eukprot:Hpha_TRINITY_DN2568_c0_g1::TRINITY_DN2568_c0_g1_i2::g.1405::m.1405
MLEHHEATGHSIVLGFLDLSFWCYKCNHFIQRSHPRLSPYHEAFHTAKMDLQAPHQQAPVQSVSVHSVHDWGKHSSVMDKAEASGTHQQPPASAPPPAVASTPQQPQALGRPQPKATTHAPQQPLTPAQPQPLAATYAPRRRFALKKPSRTHPSLPLQGVTRSLAGVGHGRDGPIPGIPSTSAAVRHWLTAPEGSFGCLVIVWRGAQREVCTSFSRPGIKRRRRGSRSSRASRGSRGGGGSSESDSDGEVGR